MAVNTKTLLSLVQSLAKANNDYISVATTTNIAGSNTVVVSTNLNEFDDSSDDHFNDWWFYMDSTNNPTVNRKVKGYTTADGNLTLYGSNLASESSSQTIYLFRYNRNQYIQAIVTATEEIFPSLHLRLDDRTLVSGNILPDPSFESWSSSTALNWYTKGTVTLAQTSTAGLFRNGLYSAKATAGAANDYFYISSDDYPRLLDLQDESVDFYCLAYPEVADDAFLEIWTSRSDGTTQTLTSTTTNAAGKFTILKLENQKLNDDLDEIQIRFKIGTNTKYVYFEDAALFGRDVAEYLLPDNFRDGHLSNVQMQVSTSQDPACYDLHPFVTGYTRDVRHEIIDEGDQRYLRLLDPQTYGWRYGWSYGYGRKHRLRLIGYKPLETLSADSDTITLDAEKVPYLIEYAKIIFFEREAIPVSIEDVKRFHYQHERAKIRSQSLFYKHRMTRPEEFLRGS